MIKFLNGIAAWRHHSQARDNPWTMFFNGVTCHQIVTAVPSGSNLALTRFYPHRGARGAWRRPTSRSCGGIDELHLESVLITSRDDPSKAFTVMRL